MTTNTAALTSPRRSTDSKRGLVLLFIGLMLSMLLAALNQTVLSTALPTMVGELNGIDQMLWVITAYILASTIAMPAYGKLGDLIGRKGLLIIAIGLFVAGSVFGALAQDMPWLIVGRVIQGLGGGGLMILSQAIIADVVPARERGKYMGAMGGVFAFSSVAGPLLGGWFTEGPGWRWAFWINIPLGAVAVLAVILFLHLPKGATARPRIDYAGMGLLGIATTCLVLLSTWGGGQYAWTSPTILGLAAGAIVASVVFVLVERRAVEPIMPLHLFKDLNFNLTTIGGLILGISMFGSLAYLPTYLQMVTGASATVAGLLMIPMMGALLLTSMLSGFYVSRTGRYKWLTIAGSVVVAVGLALLSVMNAETSVWVICCYLAVLGLGLGPGMQLLVLIVQNSFPAAEVGTATAANNFFRQIGATLGSAVVGSIFTGRLAILLAERLPADVVAAGAGGPNSLTPAIVNSLPEALRQPIITSYSDALTPVFLYMLPLSLISALVLCFIVEKPLATTLERDRPEVGDAGRPAQSDPGYGGRHDTGPEVSEKDPLPIR